MYEVSKNNVNHAELADYEIHDFLFENRGDPYLENFYYVSLKLLNVKTPKGEIARLPEIQSDLMEPDAAKSIGKYFPKSEFKPNEYIINERIYQMFMSMVIDFAISEQLRELTGDRFSYGEFTEQEMTWAEEMALENMAYYVDRFYKYLYVAWFNNGYSFSSGGEMKNELFRSVW